MNRPEKITDPNDLLKLVGEIYKSILTPESFIDVLELWDKNISSREQVEENLLDLLDEQLTTAIPLLESSLRSVLTQDELVNRVAEYDRPSLLLSTNGFVISSNSKGQSHFNLREGDRIETELMDPADRKEFTRAVSAAFAKTNEGSFRTLNLAAKNPDGKIVDHLCAVRAVHLPEHNLGYVLVSAMDLVLAPSSASAFQSSFNLTSAEMRVVSALISGKRQTDIAREDGIREDTVKKHIRNIRDKTGAPNTTALVCLTASFAQIAIEQAGISDPQAPQARYVTNSSNQTYIVPNRHRIVNVDGYDVEYLEEGPEQGEPILICHSSMVGFVLPPEFMSELVGRGYRVIVPYRPGYGVSTHLKGEFSVGKTADHMLRFAEKIGLVKFNLFAGTVGMAHAMHMAAAAPDRVLAIIGFAGYLPINRKVLHQTVARYQRAVMFTQTKNEKLAKFLVLSGYKMFLQLGPKKFMSQIMRHSKSDLDVLDNSNSLGLISLGLRVGGAQGVDALLHDTSLILADWYATLEKVKCPVHLFHGDDDSVFKQDVVQSFCKAHPQLGLTILKNRGQLMIYSDPSGLAQKALTQLPAIKNQH